MSPQIAATQGCPVAGGPFRWSGRRQGLTVGTWGFGVSMCSTGDAELARIGSTEMMSPASLAPCLQHCSRAGATRNDNCRQKFLSAVFCDAFRNNNCTMDTLHSGHLSVETTHYVFCQRPCLPNCVANPCPNKAGHNKRNAQMMHRDRFTVEPTRV